MLAGLGRLIARILLKVEIIGQDNVPRNEPLIVVSNHFSWFDGPLLTLLLPVQPAFLIATESMRLWYWRLFMRFFTLIPIWRGRVDRKALAAALQGAAQWRRHRCFPRRWHRTVFGRETRRMN
ncbi:MAG: 1-acyl-sn-glycerol-3-phosphate acyltransferase [Caldilineaceae bacterium]